MRKHLPTACFVRNEEIVSVALKEPSEVSDTSSVEIRRLDLAPMFVFVLVLMMAYGYEIFSFHLTLDEEIFGESSNLGYAKTWLAQGRWSMGILTLMIPSPVVPVVSTLLGVGFTGASLWLLSRHYLGMGPWQATFLSGVAATLPTLSFMLSFSTIAFGIGVGNVLLVGFFAGMSSSRWWMRVLGVLALAFAVGIYDSFLVAGAALSLGLVLKRPRWMTVILALGSVVLSYLISKFVAFVGQIVVGVPRDTYAESFIDVPGFLMNPLGQLAKAVGNVGEVVSLSPARFGLHSPWLLITILALVLVAAFGIFSVGGVKGKVISSVALVLLLLIPIAVEAVAPVPVLRRAMIYLPVCFLVLAGAAFGMARARSARVHRTVFAAVAVVAALATVGQATISNRLFGASELSYAQDQNVAFMIGMEKERLAGTRDEVPVVFNGSHQWAENPLMIQRETLGISFFAGIGGANNIQYRNAAFLRSQGIAVRMASEAETQAVGELMELMPSYPDSGWVDFQEGVLLVNFGAEGSR